MIVSVDTYILAKAFMSKHPWYSGPSGKDHDSVKLTQIDNHLMVEGIFKPSDPAYWAELERRAALALPYWFPPDEARDQDRT